jgi:RNA polymerase sigma-70 factor (ECF subfamily)
MDERQFLGVYDRYADALFRHCYFRTGDRERAKELVQETFTRTWQYLTDGKPIDNIRAFLYRTATNLIIDDVRRGAMLSLDALAEDGFQPRDEADAARRAHIEAQVALGHLDRLDDKHREALLLRYLDGLKPKEIADLLGESQNVISVRIHRGLQKLRTLMGAQHG